MSFPRQTLPLLLLAIAVVALYLYDLNGMGVISSDEPRYAAIGETMAQTGDFVTPRLWGSPWFEKPPLLYWMAAVATRLGFREELAGRVPVTLLSLLFLATSLWLLKMEFGLPVAAITTGMLATSAGWLAYSGLCLTDVPLAVCFALAVFLALPLIRAEPDLRGLDGRFVAIGTCLGFAALAKGPLPFALALPFLWFLREYWRYWWVAAVCCGFVALPWYVAVYAENGDPFIQEFFVRHNFERLYSASLQHVQPPYYYVPVMLSGIFPWTPLLGLLALRGFHWDQRRKFLAAIVAFGFVLFSLSLNKLPGYLLPLIPPLLALVCSYFEGKPIAQLNKGWLFACAALIACIPSLVPILTASLTIGRYTLSSLAFGKAAAFYAAAPIAVVLLAKRSSVPSLLLLCIVAAGIYFKTVCYPVLDAQVSARGVWRQLQPISDDLCDGGTNRDWIYGLSFYRRAEIPTCDKGRFHFMIKSTGRGAPNITRINP